jgi:hypothetical protein
VDEHTQAEEPQIEARQRNALPLGEAMLKDQQQHSALLLCLLRRYLQ